MARIIVLNLGSTSFKYKLFDIGTTEVMLATGGVERIGALKGRYFIRAGDAMCEGMSTCPTHVDAFELCLKMLEKMGISTVLKTLDAVGYKAVHGGAISGAQRVDEVLLEQMESMVSFAPAHNPVYIDMMQLIRERHPSLLQIACFETSFHAMMPLERAIYGVPYEWVQQYGIRRYGFHGSSHSYIAWKMQQVAKDMSRVISAHLGGSSSLCAILNGKSIATSMGATPQSGLFQNNRVGDFDVFCLPVLVERFGSQEAVMKQLSTNGGFMGISGVSNDMREVREAAAKGNKRAALAVAAFADDIVGYIGMFTAYLGGLDALVFTGGIGQNDTQLRQTICAKLGFVGAKLDEPRNIHNCAGCISTAESGIAVWVLETNEELMVARECVEFLCI